MEGFYRRSLAGSIMFFLGDLRFQYHIIAGLQIAIFICINIVIICAWIKQDPISKWMLPILLISPAGGYFFHEIGYIDQLLYLLLFIAVFSKNQIFASFLVVGSLLLHEMTLFTTLPLYVGYLIINDRPKAEIQWVVISSFGLFGLLYLFFQTVDADQLNTFVELAKRSADYPIRIAYYDVFSNRFIGIRSQWYYSAREMWNSCLLIPLWVMAGYMFSRKITLVNNKVSFLMGFFCAFSPMLLGFFGWDCSRWIFLSIISSFFCFYIAREIVTPKIIFIIGLIMLTFGVFGFLDYFDWFTPRLGDIEKIVQFLQGGFFNLLYSIPQRF